MSETEKSLNCPKCNEPMRRLKANGAEVDRCGTCFGIWLDAGERLKILKDKSLVTGVDIGPTEIGERKDAIQAVDCPRCGEAMRHIHDRAQKHIGYEFCPDCQGSFFDAGELTDLSEFTLTERIRAAFGS
jgi:Zn-finger nucleic acid-binding protein